MRLLLPRPALAAGLILVTLGLACQGPSARKRRMTVVISPCAPTLPPELRPQEESPGSGPAAPGCLPPRMPVMAGALEDVPRKYGPGDHADLPPGELPFRAAFRAMPIRARLVVGQAGGATFIGGLVKAKNTDRIRVQTLRRLCGNGIASRKPTLSADRLEFQVKYRWCRVDPGDIVNTRCVKCDMVLYKCALNAEDLRGDDGPTPGSSYKKPVQCTVTEKTFCEKDCNLRL